MSAPFIAGNVTFTELEEMRIQNLGSTFEQTFLGRSTECLECHISESSVTYNAVESQNRHFPVDGLFETAVYGPQAQASLEHRALTGCFDSSTSRWPKTTRSKAELPAGLHQRVRYGSVLRRLPDGQPGA